MRPELSATLLWIWRAALVLGLAALALHDGLGFGRKGLFDIWVYEGVELLAALGCLVRAVVKRDERGAWTALGLGLLLTTTGDFLYDVFYGSNPPYPSLADVFYLAFYPACYVGIVLLVRRRISGFGRSLWLDGLTAAAAIGALGASLLLEVVVRSTQGSPLVVLTTLAYPLGDIILLALLGFVFVISGWRPGRAWTLIAFALLLNAIGDGVFLYQSAVNTYVEGTLLDVVWPASLVLVALTAWQAPASRRPGGLERKTLFATPAVCGLVATGVLIDGTLQHLHPLAIGLAAATIVLVLLRTGLTFRENTRLLESSVSDSLTDALTQIGNRRKLVLDLAAYAATATPEDAHLLVIFDLNGFKDYNDTFGHPAGDALLARLAGKLASAISPAGTAYRLGGDEFCALIPASETLLDRAASSLQEEGETFVVSSAFGAVALPSEAADASEALRLADQRLYANKQQRSTAEGSGPHEVLLRTLAEREPEIRSHLAGVAELASAAGRELRLAGDQLEELRLAAELHDVGKLALPDALLLKPEPLSDEERRFVEQHTLVGQRILTGAPALRSVGKIVRSSHERWDGTGYPDGLHGEEIPLAARIIAVCDAFSAMTRNRPYRVARSRTAAIDELRACAGSQFDPDLVEVLCSVLEAEQAPIDPVSRGD